MTEGPESATSVGRTPLRRTLDWLAGSRLGLVVMALIVGAGAGLGAAVFRDLVYFFTWVFTGHRTYGEFGHTASAHLPSLGIWFVLIVPVLAGLLYGPLIQRFAREARGHGVPEVMLAVAENGGRIRPPVTVVKALASALCIGGGGSVGREGPIVQIGSALASTLGQWVRMSEGRLRMIVACGAAGAISATFNAPITGVFFGFEIVLKEFSLDALSATILSAVTADVISRAFFGGAPFFTAVPHDLTVTNDVTYLLIGVLGITAGTDRRRVSEDAVQGRRRSGQDLGGSAGVAASRRRRSAPRARAARAAADVRRRLPGDGSRVRGSLSPVVRRPVDGRQDPRRQPHAVDRRIGRRVRAVTVHRRELPAPRSGSSSTTCSAPPSGRRRCMASWRWAACSPRRPRHRLTAIASVAEMTGNFTLALPIMLACGISAQLAKRITHGSIYTTKLLRRGIDIERPKAIGALQALTVGEVMQPLADLDGHAPRFGDGRVAERAAVDGAVWERLVGPVTLARQPQVLFADEDLERARRQLVLYGRDGLPGALPRRPAARVADPRRRSARARDDAQLGRTRDRGRSQQRPNSPRKTRARRFTPPARHCAATKCSSSGSCRALRPAGVASRHRVARRAAPSSRSRRVARSTPHTPTSSCVPVSGRSCSRRPRTTGGTHSRWRPPAQVHRPATIDANGVRRVASSRSMRGSPADRDTERGEKVSARGNGHA